ncbi:MAG: hypothetical protein ACM37U_15415 [Gemmatimonas sp.]
MSSTLAELEHKLNVMQVVRDHPWPALAVAAGAGVLLSGSRVDAKADTAAVTATKGASSRLGSVLDDVVATLMIGVHQALDARINGWVDDLKTALGGRARTASRPTIPPRAD